MTDSRAVLVVHGGVCSFAAASFCSLSFRPVSSLVFTVSMRAVYLACACVCGGVH